MSGPSRELIYALGANLGDPSRALASAARQLAAVLERPRASAVYRTAPEGGGDQPEYLNAVVAGISSMTAREGLALARELEARAGRERPYPGAPRTLDVDLLFAGDELVDDADLVVPHPRWATRPFVVVPLMDVAPDVVDPRTGITPSAVASSHGWTSALFPMVLEPGALIATEAA